MKSIIELVAATTLKTSPDNAEECRCTNPTRQPVILTHGPCPVCCIQSVTCIVKLSWSPSYLLIGQVVRFPTIAEVRPLSNCSLPRACSQDRTTSEHGYNEIERLDCLGFSKQASLLPSLCFPPPKRDGPLAGLQIFFYLHFPQTAAVDIGAKGSLPTLGWLGSLATQSLDRSPSQHDLLPISKFIDINLWDKVDNQLSQSWGFISLPGELWRASLYTHTSLPQCQRSIIALHFLPGRRGTLPFRAHFALGFENYKLMLSFLSSAHPF